MTSRYARRVADRLEFLRGDLRHQLRMVAIPAVPGGRPKQADSADHIKSGSPAEVPHQGNDDQRRKRTADSACHPRNADCTPALAYGKPSGDGSGNIWECACFAGTEKELDDQ